MLSLISFSNMEITKGLQDDIVKIQNELITAIQNHQVGYKLIFTSLKSLILAIYYYYKLIKT